MANQESTRPAIPVTAQVLGEAEALSDEIVKDIELSRKPISVVILKAVRLACLLNDFETQQAFEAASSGHPQRSIEPVEKLEQNIAKGKAVLPNAHMMRGYGGKRVLYDMDRATEKLAGIRTVIHGYATRKYYEIKFSSLADDVFSRIRSRVDSSIGLAIPDAVKKLTAAYDNLRSNNPEDWANAVHSCRRVLQDLADAVFPPRDEVRTRRAGGVETPIQLGSDNYINRLMAYVEDLTGSRRFEEIVGSHLRYMGDRLDALFAGAQKGSHASVTNEEADRCVVYTYLLVGDILSLGSWPRDDNTG